MSYRMQHKNVHEWNSMGTCTNYSPLCTSIDRNSCQKRTSGTWLCHPKNLFIEFYNLSRPPGKSLCIQIDISFIEYLLSFF